MTLLTLDRKHVNTDNISLVIQILAVAFAISIPIANVLTTSIGLLLLLACILGMDRNTLAIVLKHPTTIAIMIFVGLHIAAISYSIADQAEILQALRKNIRLLLFPLLLPAFMHSNRLRHYAILAFCVAFFISIVSSLLINSLLFKDTIFTSLFAAFTIFTLAHYSMDYAKYRWLSLPSIGFLTYYLFFIATGRVGQILFILLFMLFVWQRFAHTAKKQLCSIAILACIIMSSLLLPSSFTSRQALAIREIKQYLYSANDDANAKNTSMGLRLTFYKNTWEIIKIKPFLGWGTGAFKAAYAKYAPQPHADNIVVSNPHNQYLLTWAQLGIPGILSLLYLFYTLCSSFLGYRKIEGFLGTGLMCAIMFGCSINSWLLDYTSMFFFVFFATALASARSDVACRDIPAENL